MRIFILLIFLSIFSLALTGCRSSEPLQSDEEISRLAVESPEKSKPQKTGFLIQDLEIGMIKSTYSCGICYPDEKCLNGKCQKIPLENKNVCGNYQCESDESFSGKAFDFLSQTKECYFDCNPPCLSETTEQNLCNQYAEVHCACDEYSVLSQRHGCIKNAPACNDCGVQEPLFSEVLKIQTEIIQCLSDYFEYQPNRLVYKVFNNPTLEKCTQPEGCIGIEGGIGGADYVIFHNLNGFRSLGEVVPTKPEFLTADVHETTHYFLYQMLHGLPSWFHEAVAIQTNERLNCSARQAPWGEAYLQERENQKGGIYMDDGTTLNIDFYQRLRDGKTQLSQTELESSHILGTLFAIGLKEDYQCSFECFKDVIIKLREQEQKFCRLGNGKNCAVVNYENSINVFGLGVGESDDWEEITTGIIKDVFDDVTGKNTQPLFNLLELGKNQPTPGACGPTTCTN